MKFTVFHTRDDFYDLWNDTGQPLLTSAKPDEIFERLSHIDTEPYKIEFINKFYSWR